MQLQSLCSSRSGQTGVPQRFVKTSDQTSIVAQQQAAEQAGVQAGWGLWQPLLPCKGRLLTCTCHHQVKARHNSRCNSAIAVWIRSHTFCPMHAADTRECSPEGGKAVPLPHDTCHHATLCMGLWTHFSIVMSNVMLLRATNLQQPHKWSHRVTATLCGQSTLSRTE